MVKVIIELAEAKVGAIVSYLMAQQVGKVSVESVGQPSPIVNKGGKAQVDYCLTSEAMKFKDEVMSLNIPLQQREIVAYLLSLPNSKATALEMVSGLGMKLTSIHSAVQKLRHTEPPLVEAKVRD